MTYGQAKIFRRALDRFVGEISESAVEVNDYMPIIREWTPGSYISGDVRIHLGIPYKCVQPHDSSLNPGWNPADTPSLWMQYHGTTPGTARPWIRPTGAHDIYRAGEYMIWTGGTVMLCVVDTNYSPDEYTAAWQRVDNDI